MTATNWIALVVPIVGLIGGALVYVMQKYIDRENEIKRERRVLYRKAAIHLERVHQELKKNSPDLEQQLEELRELERIVAEVQVSAPDPVAKIWAEIPENVGVVSAYQLKDEGFTADETNKMAEAIMLYQNNRAKALKAMRDDSFAGSKVTYEMIRKAMAEMSSVSDMIVDIGRIVR